MLKLSSLLRRLTPAQALALALALLTLLAAVARYWQLTTLPPGYWYDEAHKSLVALQIARGEAAPVYVTDYQGIEAGFFWLLAACFRLAGPSYFGARVLSAALGTLTIPLTFWSIRELYHSLPQAGLIALTTAAWLSFVLWHVHWSRLGYETILVPLFAVALLGLMAWAWRLGQPLCFVVVGLTLGLSQYSHPAARLLVAQAIVTFFIFARGGWQLQAQRGLLIAAAALLIYAPLGLFFIRHPEWFFTRLSFTSAGARAGGWEVVVANAVRTLGGLNFRGDVMPRQNLSLRPALDPIASLCMLLGGLAFWHWRWQWRRHLALLCALGLSLVPMVFSDGAPGFGRTLGAAPFVMTLPALGLTYLAIRVRRRLPAALLCAGLLAASAGLNLFDYFVRYPRQPGLFDAFEVGQWTLIRAAQQASAAGTGYLILDEAALAHPATRLAGRLAKGDLRAYDGRACLAYPALTSAPTTLAVLARWVAPLQVQFPQAESTIILHEPEVYPYGYLIHLPAGTQSQAAGSPHLAHLGDNLALLAADVPSQAVSPGSTVAVFLRWQAVSPESKALHFFVHLGGVTGPPLAGADGEPCPGYGLDRWHAGEIVEHTVPLTLPPELAAGTYPVYVGLYDWVSGERLPVEAAGTGEPDRIWVGAVTVE